MNPASIWNPSIYYIIYYNWLDMYPAKKCSSDPWRKMTTLRVHHKKKDNSNAQLAKKSTDPQRKKHLRDAPHTKKRFSDPRQKIWLHDVLLVEKRLLIHEKRCQVDGLFIGKSLQSIIGIGVMPSSEWILTRSWGLSF